MRGCLDLFCSGCNVLLLVLQIPSSQIAYLIKSKTRFFSQINMVGGQPLLGFKYQLEASVFSALASAVGLEPKPELSCHLPGAGMACAMGEGEYSRQGCGGSHTMAVGAHGGGCTVCILQRAQERLCSLSSLTTCPPQPLPPPNPPYLQALSCCHCFCLATQG